MRSRVRFYGLAVMLIILMTSHDFLGQELPFHLRNNIEGAVVVKNEKFIFVSLNDRDQEIDLGHYAHVSLNPDRTGGGIKHLPFRFSQSGVYRLTGDYQSELVWAYTGEKGGSVWLSDDGQYVLWYRSVNSAFNSPYQCVLYQQGKMIKHWDAQELGPEVFYDSWTGIRLGQDEPDAVPDQLWVNLRRANGEDVLIDINDAKLLDRREAQTTPQIMAREVQALHWSWAPWVYLLIAMVILGFMYGGVKSCWPLFQSRS